MKRFFAFFIALATLLPAALPASAATLTAGTLIKASGQAVYYYANDGKRYVFPTEKTYKSWYADFSGVVTITDTELAAIQIGGNVTYRPGTRMVKVTTDPKVYAIQGTQLRWVVSETLAVELFGANWAAQIDDIPDPFFTNYTIGAQITAASDFSPTNVRDDAATIQVVLDGEETTPPPPSNEPEDPEDEDEPTVDIVLSLEKSEAQANERIDILAEVPPSVGTANIILSVDGVGAITTCNSFTCGDTWTVPSAGVQSSYTVRAKLTKTNGDVQEVTKILTIVSMPVSPLARITANRLVLKPTQFPNIRAIVDTELRPSRTDIIIDGVAMKTCSDTPTDCPYPDYLTGPIGTTYEIYALVITSDGLTYKSATVTITLAENDTPLIQFAADSSSIASGETVGVTATAEDDDGIEKIEISYNNEVLKTCLGAAPCSVTTGPWNLSSGTVLTFNANAWDLKGAVSATVTSVTIQ